MSQTLSRNFYNRSTESVAKELLGKYLMRQQNNILKVGKIVETEAYIGSHDLASHARFGKTKRNAPMFGPPGFSYVFFIYGVYHCFNIVTEGKDSGSAVLIRAVEPIENIDGKTNGPGLLCKALGIDFSLNGTDVTQVGPLYVEDRHKPLSPAEIGTSPRVGVPYAKEWIHKPLRFFLKSSQFVSQ